MPAVVAGTAGLITTLRPGGHLLYRLLTTRILLLTGLMSYSLYLWHWSVLAIAHWTVGIRWFTAPFLLAAIVGLAASSYVFVERPLRRAKWSTSGLGAAGHGLAAIAFVAGLNRNPPLVPRAPLGRLRLRLTRPAGSRCPPACHLLISSP
jgi:peptidoglycan/LPS O-acetylase OafA/YrhL